MGHIATPMAAMDLFMAVHRRRENCSGPRVLHPVHRDKPLHHVRHGDSGLLRASDGYVYTILEDLERNGEATERSTQPAGRQEGQQQTFQFQLVSSFLS